jgi:branched-chain amino acid transport system permease protein
MSSPHQKPTGFLIGFSVILVVLVLIPFFVDLFYMTFLTEVLVWVLFAVSFDLIFGYTGLLSFGQALFFGIGAYSMAIPISKLGIGPIPSFFLAILVPMAFAGFVGYFSVRLSGIHFVIITLIFALIGSTLGETWTSLTGGADGLTIPFTPLSVGPLTIDLTNINTNYYLVLIVVTVCYLLLRRLVHSPLGKVFIAIRENEDRARLIGYNVKRYKLLAFVIAGALSGVAGGLYGITLKYASANFLHWGVSGHAVVYTIVGGMGTLLGPVIGTGIIMILEHYLVNFLQGTDLVIGIVLVFMVLVAPKGLVGLLKRNSG